MALQVYHTYTTVDLSNFQMDIVDIESVNSAAPGQTVQFLALQEN
jgi:hypothetical protein